MGRLLFVVWIAAAVFASGCATVCAGELRLAGGQRWIVVAARQDKAEAEDLAREYGREVDGVRVVRSANGWFAVLIGPTSTSSIAEAKKSLEPRLWLPEDAYLSRGENYVETVFEPPPTPVSAFAAYDGERPVTLQYGDLAITLDSASAEEGLRAPIVTVRSGGKIVFTARIDDDPSEKPQSQARIIKLDPRSASPQIVFSYYSGGAHCCTITRIGTRIGEGSWRVVDAGSLDGAGGYGFEDIDGDGAVELLSVDNSFLYAFASYAESVAPPKAQRLSDGVLHDVTDEPSSRSFLQRELRRIETMAAKNPELWRNNGFLGGWVAAKAQLGEVDEAWRRMLKSYDRHSDWVNEACAIPVDLDRCPADKKRKLEFPEALRLHLLAHGYPAPREAVPPPTLPSGR
jgi:serine protease Do